MLKNIEVEFVSDVSCPWCAVGYYEFKQAVAQLGDKVQVNVSWLPFEINPTMVAGGQDVKSYLFEKYGMTEPQQLQNMANIELRGFNAGFEFKPMVERHVYNSFDCHCLLEVAKETGVQTALKEKLFAAYFQQSIDISDRESLRTFAQFAGLPPKDIERAFEDKNIRQHVKQQIKDLSQMGVTSVPTMIINQQYGVAGAQGASGYLDILQQVIDK